METRPGEGVLEDSKHQETLLLAGLWGFGISEGNITGRKK